MLPLFNLNGVFGFECLFPPYCLHCLLLSRRLVVHFLVAGFHMDFECLEITFNFVSFHCFNFFPFIGSISVIFSLFLSCGYTTVKRISILICCKHIWNSLRWLFNWFNVDAIREELNISIRKMNTYHTPNRSNGFLRKYRNIFGHNRSGCLHQSHPVSSRPITYCGRLKRIGWTSTWQKHRQPMSITSINRFYVNAFTMIFCLVTN